MSNADATLVETTGAVFVEREGVRIALTEGDSIYESDTIITGDNTTADIVFRDGTKSRLSENTELKLTDFDFGAGEEPSFILDLAQGAMRTVSGEVVKLNPEAFEVITPRATIGIRGTEFINSVSDTGESHIVLFISKGAAMVITRADGQSTELTTPLQMVEFLQGDQGSLTVESFSLTEMESIINNITSTLGKNIPTTKQEQGDWASLDSVSKTQENTEEENIAEEAEAIEATEKAESVKETTETNNAETSSHVSTVVLLVQEIAASEGIVEALENIGVVVTVTVLDANMIDNNAFDTSDTLGILEQLANSLGGTSSNEAGTLPPVSTPIETINMPSFDTSATLPNSATERIINIEGEVSGNLAGNALKVASSSGTEGVLVTGTTSGDTITVGSVSNNGSIYGDAQTIVGNAQTIIFGHDTIIIEGELKGAVYGDIETATTDSELYFGHDTIKVGTLVANGTIYGDIGTVVSNGTTVHGHDTIIVGEMEGGSIYGDYKSSGTSGGDDTIIIGSIDINSGTGTIMGNGGADVITINGSVDVSGLLQIDGGSESDTITINGSVEAGNSGQVIIKGGDGKLNLGNDTITINGSVEVKDGGRFSIDGGAGDDKISLNGGFEQSGSSAIKLTGGDGADEFYVTLTEDGDGTLTFTDYDASEGDTLTIKGSGVTGDDFSYVNLDDNQGIDFGYNPDSKIFTITFEDGDVFSFAGIDGRSTPQEAYAAIQDSITWA